MQLRARLLSGEIRRQGQRVAVPGRDDALLVIGKLAANAIRIGHQESSAETERCIAEFVCVRPGELALRFTQRRREEDVGRALAGKVRGDLKEIHAAAGDHGGREELRRLAAFGGLALQGDDILSVDLRSGRGHVLGIHRFSRCRGLAAAGKQQSSSQQQEQAKRMFCSQRVERKRAWIRSSDGEAFATERQSRREAHPFYAGVTQFQFAPATLARNGWFHRTRSRWTDRHSIETRANRCATTLDRAAPTQIKFLVRHPRRQVFQGQRFHHSRLPPRGRAPGWPWREGFQPLDLISPSLALSPSQAGQAAG